MKYTVELHRTYENELHTEKGPDIRTVTADDFDYAPKSDSICPTLALFEDEDGTIVAVFPLDNVISIMGEKEEENA